MRHAQLLQLPTVRAEIRHWLVAVRALAATHGLLVSTHGGDSRSAAPAAASGDELQSFLLARPLFGMLHTRMRRASQAMYTQGTAHEPLSQEGEQQYLNPPRLLPDWENAVLEQDWAAMAEGSGNHVSFATFASLLLQLAVAWVDPGANTGAHVSSSGDVVASYVEFLEQFRFHALAGVGGQADNPTPGRRAATANTPSSPPHATSAGVGPLPGFTVKKKKKGHTEIELGSTK